MASNDSTAVPVPAAPGMHESSPWAGAGALPQFNTASQLTAVLPLADGGSAEAAPAAQLYAADEAAVDTGTAPDNGTLNGILARRTAAAMQPQTLSAEAAVKAALAEATLTSVNPSVPATPKPDLAGTFEAAQGSGALTCHIPDLVTSPLSSFCRYFAVCGYWGQSYVELFPCASTFMLA